MLHPSKVEDITIFTPLQQLQIIRFENALQKLRLTRAISRMKDIPSLETKARLKLCAFSCNSLYGDCIDNGLYETANMLREKYKP